MVQDTRKDPRAKVLTMTVRYKSATIDEFIEHHSHDVSRGGIFIKTPSPFPPGTLLKFEIRIAEDQSIIGGVGRVVWKRDSSQSSGERPSGMGVKFLKIDENSRKVIDQIIDNKGDASSAFEESDEPMEAPAKEEPDATPAPAVVRPAKSHKATMLGLGAVGQPADAEEPHKEDKPQEASFFPKTDSENEMPPPEERTVMKQAAELLAEALKGAGGSMEEIGAAPETAEPKTDKPEEKKPIGAADTTPIPSDEDEAPKPEPKKADEEKKTKESDAPDKDEDDEEDEPPKKVVKKDSSPPPPKAEPKPVKPAPVVSAREQPAEEQPEGGSFKVLLMVIAAIAALAIVGYYFVLPGLDEGTTPPVDTTAEVPPPVPTEPVRVEPEAAPAEDAAPEAAPDATPDAPSEAEPEAAAPPATTPPPPPPPPPQTAAPKPPAPKPPAAKPPAPKPPAPKPPAPKPPPADDNPY